MCAGTIHELCITNDTSQLAELSSTIDTDRHHHHIKILGKEHQQLFFEEKKCSETLDLINILIFLQKKLLFHRNRIKSSSTVLLKTCLFDISLDLSIVKQPELKSQTSGYKVIFECSYIKSSTTKPKNIMSK